ncbi:hypothetical protein LTR96_010185 [Exophiala xenobiotica]|nr:hypothetical protein H2202_009050 [Exophiala xenobiotica]KAK5197717.1 hypothetical protein LTR92_001959 [Exophiala xenobiotica]KAK5204294.1 hypothetical protein LTR41_010028 [Exophiala xenobiotica]KAK5227706.1 hypothetical protein LTR47_008513 [Exophiala xenobiotica]KAK5246097.1 hypothetical protein LTS06_008561 [Exophiala xenobiotica]
MSSPTNNFLSLIPTAHRVAVITDLASPTDDSLIPALQKTRRSSSTTSTDSDAVEEPTLPVTVTGTDKTPVASALQFLKLGN